MRQNALHRLRQLDALDQIDQLQAIVRDYASRVGAFPRDWSALARAGYLPGTPIDPEGTPYSVDPQTGVVMLAPQSSLIPLPTGQQGLAGRR